MAEQPTTTPPHVDPDHVVLQALAQKLRGAGVVDNQVSRTVPLSEDDAKHIADTLEQVAGRLEAALSGARPGVAKP